MRKALPSVKKITEIMDDVFQMYIRYRDGFKCICCGWQAPIGDKENMHAGHYISRGKHSTRWDEFNVNSQCKGCNGRQSWGDTEVTYRYTEALKRKYGVGIVDDLIRKSHEIYKANRVEMLSNIVKYKTLLKEYYDKSGVYSTACEKTLKNTEKFLNKYLTTP